MAKPKPTILTRKKNEKGHSIEILAAEGVFSVLYEGRPINVRHCSIPMQEKYRRTSFPAPGYARTMADKLNREFNTDKFTVSQMVLPVDGE